MAERSTPLGQLMRALADRQPEHAAELRAKADAFDTATHNFEHHDSNTFPLRSETLIATWRSARQFFNKIAAAENGVTITA